MMSALVLRQRLEVRRAPLHSPAPTDDWTQSVYDPDITVVTVDGQVWPLKLEEVASLADVGAEVGDYGAIVVPADVRKGDRIRIVGNTSTTYQVRSAADAAGIGHHLKLLLRLVAP